MEKMDKTLLKAQKFLKNLVNDKTKELERTSTINKDKEIEVGDLILQLLGTEEIKNRSIKRIKIKNIITNETEFLQKKVIPFLLERGHSIMGLEVMIGTPEWYQKVDIVSTYNNEMYFTEVKLDDSLTNLYNSIGQCIVTYFISERLKNPKLQIITQKTTLTKRYKEFAKFLKDNLGIELISL